jgi:hypothetical protein
MNVLLVCFLRANKVFSQAAASVSLAVTWHIKFIGMLFTCLIA